LKFCSGNCVKKTWPPIIIYCDTQSRVISDCQGKKFIFSDTKTKGRRIYNTVWRP
jgi:hypothetical protein